MTQQEALHIEAKCDEFMSEALQTDCEVSMALTGKLKVEFDDGYVTFSRNEEVTPVYVNYTGWYSDLAEMIRKATECIKQYRESFEKLMWSYEHIRELED